MLKLQVVSISNDGPRDHSLLDPLAPNVNYNFNFVIGGTSTPYSINMLITCISMCKVLIVFRTIFRYSKWGKMS